jgi:hypothetical protein
VRAAGRAEPPVCRGQPWWGPAPRGWDPRPRAPLLTLGGRRNRGSAEQTHLAPCSSQCALHGADVLGPNPPSLFVSPTAGDIAVPPCAPRGAVPTTPDASRRRLARLTCRPRGWSGHPAGTTGDPHQVGSAAEGRGMSRGSSGLQDSTPLRPESDVSPASCLLPPRSSATPHPFHAPWGPPSGLHRCAEKAPSSDAITCSPPRSPGKQPSPYAGESAAACRGAGDRALDFKGTEPPSRAIPSGGRGPYPRFWMGAPGTW